MPFLKNHGDIKDGYLYLPESSGLNVHLTAAIEKEFAFREDAVYDCLVRDSKKLPDSIWK